jgi:hypothetical protein
MDPRLRQGWLAGLLCLALSTTTVPALATPLFGPAIPFDLAPVDPALGVPPRGIAVGDLNEDGKLDLAIPNYAFSGTLSICIGNGDGTFHPRQDYWAGAGAVAAIVADLNGDGHQDVIVGGEDTITLWVLLGRGDGTLDAGVGIPVPNFGETRGIAAADVNGDGKLDLLAGGPYSIQVLLGNGDGTFRQGTTCHGSSPTLGDVNHDGNVDIVSPYFGGTDGPLVLLGNGDGTFQAERLYPGATNSGYSAAITDLDHDGNSDIVIESFWCVSIHTGNGSGAFPTYTYYNTSMGEPGQQVIQAQGLAVGDLDNDGLADVALANQWSGPAGVRVLRGSIDRVFSDFTLGSVESYGSANSYAVAIADLNRDGRMDLVSPGEVLLNVGPFPPAAPTVVPALSIRVAGPIGGSLGLRYRLPSSGAATIEVFDVGGRLVARRSVRASGTSWETTVFQSLRSGVYLVRLNHAGKSKVSRGVVVR